MKLFVLWSGGKDCMLALHRIIQDKQHEVSYLVNMCDTDGGHSRSHGICKQLIAQQASSMGIDIMQPESDFVSYETCFKIVIASLKEKGITGGIFGDIYLQPHRDWIERVCSEMNIQPFFPLWKNNTIDLIHEFIDSGFKAIIISVNAQYIQQSWLGRDIDMNFLHDILELKNIDPCAENGEYHSFVYDGPIFREPVVFSKRRQYFKDNHWFLNLQ
jgi:diphthine-ammonia ligase